MSDQVSRQMEDGCDRGQHEEELPRLNEDLVASLELAHQRLARAEAGEARYRKVVELLPDTVCCLFDRQHQIIEVIGPGLGARGFDVDAIPGRLPDEVFAPDIATRCHELLDAAFAGHTVRQEVQSQASGAWFLVEMVLMAQAGDDDAEAQVLLVARDTSAAKAREQSLAEAEGRWRSAFDEAPVAMIEMGSDGTILAANAAMAALADSTVERLEGTNIADYFDVTDRPEVGRRVAALEGRLRGEGLEQKFTTQSGAVKWISARASRLPGQHGQPGRIVTHAIDVTEQHQARDELEAARAQFAALVEHSTDVIMVIGADGIVSYVSPAHTINTGEPAESIVGTTTLDHTHPADRARVERAFQRVLSDEGASVTFETRGRHADGSWHHFEVTLTNRLHDPAIRGVVSNARDITDRVEATTRLAYQAMHDALTDLPNRALLLDRLDHALARSTRSRQPCAVLFLDLDRFKEINDTLGHAVGDQMLVTIARRIRDIARPGDSVVRLGGDEFVVLAEDIDGTDDAIAVAERVLDTVRAPMVLDGREVTITGSIGIALSDDATAGSLLQESDMAMYQAKRNGRNRYEVYDEAMRLDARRRFDVEALLRTAVEGKQLEVQYQPIIELSTRAPVGHEALARIRDAGANLLYPDEFIPIAEESGLIVALGANVLDQACAQQLIWNVPDASARHIAVNVSARQLASSDFVALVSEALSTYELEPDTLCLELTESALIDASSDTAAHLGALKDLGVTLALDDFGTGWSSLIYLRRFPIDIVKIDRSFVAGLGVNTHDTEVVKAVISLGRALDMLTVAEGVESEMQHRLLCDLGCHLAQGFLYGRPQPAGT